MCVLDRLQKFLMVSRKLFIFIMSAFTAITAVLIVLMVALRYIFMVSIAWSSEFVGVSLVWITFAGAAVATIDQSNISLNILANKASPRARLVIKIVINLFILLFAGILTRYGFKTMVRGFSTNMVALPVNLGLITSVIPASGLIMGLSTFVHINGAIKAYLGGQN